MNVAAMCALSTKNSDVQIDIPVIQCIFTCSNWKASIFGQNVRQGLHHIVSKVHDDLHKIQNAQCDKQEDNLNMTQKSSDYSTTCLDKSPVSFVSTVIIAQCSELNVWAWSSTMPVPLIAYFGFKQQIKAEVYWLKKVLTRRVLFRHHL